MANIKKPGTIDTDAALTSDDPQSQVASQGWGYIDPLGKAYGALKEGQQNARQFDQDLSGSVQSMKDLVKTGVASNPQADQALAAHTNGMAMGTLKSEGKAPKFKINSEEGYTTLEGKGVKATANELGPDYGTQYLDTEEHGLPYENPASIESLTVDPKHQGNGLGTNALQALESHLKDQGHDSIILNASPMGAGNQARDPKKLDSLIKFYKENGYEPFGPKESSNQVMHKSLDSKKSKSGKLSYASGGYIDSDVTSDDPQSQVASQGWSTIASHPAIQQAMDVTGNLKNYDDMVSRAAGSYKDKMRGGAGDPAAEHELADRSLATAMGTLKTPEELKADGYHFITQQTPEGYRVRAFTPEVIAESKKYKYPENFLEGKHIGHLGLVRDASNRTMSEPGIVSVDVEHQRKGIATAMYRAAEDAEKELTNNNPEYVPYSIAPAKTQLEDGSALWSQPNRPFGKQPLSTPIPAPKAYSLPMDEVSRLARAQEMGFDTSKTYYHGTDANIDEFKLSKARNSNMFGKGVYVSESPEEAGSYTQKWNDDLNEYGPADGGNILPVHVKASKTLDIQDVPKAVKKDLAQLVADKRGIKLKDLGPDYLDGAGAHDILAAAQTHGATPEEITDIFKSHGYDSVKRKSILNVFEPTQIKSKFAEFDPKKAKSGKLSYAEGGEVRQNYAGGGITHAPLVPSIPNPLPPALPGAAPQANLGEPSSSEIDQFLSTPQQSAPQGLNHNAPEGIDEFIGNEMREAKYGTSEQQLKAGAEGLAQGVAGPLAPLAEKHLFGVKDEDIRGRADVNPATHFAGEVGGLLAPAILSGGASLAGKGAVGTALGAASKFNQAGLLEGVGSALAKKLAPVTLAGKIGTGAARAAVENMILAGGDETSKMIINDPSASAQHAIASVALSGLLGGAIGGTMSGMGSLFDPKLGGKLGQMGADFKAQIKSHIDTPDPVRTMHEELSNSLSEADKVFDDTFGAHGIKAEAISKLVPHEITPQIVEQLTAVSDKLESSLNKLAEKGDPHAGLLEDKIAKFRQAANSQETGTMFNAMQDLKQQLQAESKYTEGVSPLSERAYRSTVKNLAYDLRTSLEDSKVWGDAAHVQADINAAASKYFPAIKDFKSLMTTKIMGEPHVDPGKINTYLNQLGNANAEIKQVKMKNFVDNMDMFKAAVNKTYSRLGLESPIQPTSMNYTLSTLGEKSTGSKLADFFVKKGLTDAGGKGMGAAIGGGLGHAMGGMGEIGALIGAHALGPFFSSTMPAIAKAVLKLPESGTGFRAASNYGAAVAKGYQLTQQATKNVFRIGSEVLPQSYMPSDKDRAKLQKTIDLFTKDPNKLLSAQNQVGHYLPEHAGAVSKTTMNAINYLNSLKPTPVRKSPLDPKPVLSSTAQAKYDNALNIAEQPLYVLHKIQKGTLNHNDVEALSTMYPEYYTNMKQNLMGQIADLQAKHKPVPYSTQNVLSLFMGQPMNSTTTPASIQSMQAAQAGKAQDQGQPDQGGAGPKRSTASLNKMPGMYQTPGQTGAARRQRP